LLASSDADCSPQIFAVVSTITLVDPDVVVASIATISFTAFDAAVDDAGVAFVGTGATMSVLLAMPSVPVAALALLLAFALGAFVAFLLDDEPPCTCKTQ
jgi:hypothetical protein